MQFITLFTLAKTNEFVVYVVYRIIIWFVGSGRLEPPTPVPRGSRKQPCAPPGLVWVFEKGEPPPFPIPPPLTTLPRLDESFLEGRGLFGNKFYTMAKMLVNYEVYTTEVCCVYHFICGIK